MEEQARPEPWHPQLQMWLGIGVTVVGTAFIMLTVMDRFCTESPLRGILIGTTLCFLGARRGLRYYREAMHLEVEQEAS